MTEEQAMQYTKIAEEKAFEELEKQYSIHFKLKKKPSSVFESKIGGIPYFPEGSEIPVDSNGDQLRFLMQINCGEIPKMDNLPTKGMLQFWIAADDCWGMCDKNDKGFRVIYYNDITENTVLPSSSEFSDLEKEFFPLHGEFGVEFELIFENFPKNSWKYEVAFCKYFNELSGENIQSIYDMEYKLHLPYSVCSEARYANNSAYGHKIGGSSDFCQDDPRITEEQEKKYDFQLLQMSSDFGSDCTNIMWGDAGICHFFINSEKLKNCEFSDILYYCDCC